MTSTVSTTAPVTTGLYIGGQERSTQDVLEVVDPARPGVVVGRAAAATKEDVADAVAAANAAFPAWAALSATERAARMAAAIEGLADERDEDARILSLENGKIVHEAWVDALVFEIRWQLALSLADEVEATKVLPPAPGIPVRTTVAYQPIGVVTVIVPFNWPIAILAAALPHALLAGNTAIVKPPPSTPLATTRLVQRAAETLPPGALKVSTGGPPPVPARRREVAAGRAQRGHRPRSRDGRPDRQPRHREGLLHRQRQRRQADHGNGLPQPDPGPPRARRQRPGDHPRGRRP